MDSNLATIPETDEESENAVSKAQGNPSPVAAMGPPPSPGYPVLRHGGTMRYLQSLQDMGPYSTGSDHSGQMGLLSHQ